MKANVCVVIRVWSKDAGNAVASAKRAIAANVFSVVVVVKDDDTVHHDGAVKRAVKSIPDTRPGGPGPIHVIEMREGYSCANALNAAFNWIRYYNRRQNDFQQITHVLSVSNEVEWRCEDLDTMFQVIEDTGPAMNVGIVGAPFMGIDRNGKTAPLFGKTYQVPRNTFMLISMEAYREVGYFNPICDSFGGMEDVNFILWMLLITSFAFRMINLPVIVQVGVNYDQRVKEERELVAIRKIIAHTRSVVGNDPGRQMDLDRALRALGIADLA